MKTDHFAEFRRPSLEAGRNKGNRVTTCENSPETKSPSSDASVTPSGQQQAAKVTEPNSISAVTPVTPAVDEWVTERAIDKSNKNQGESEPVTSATRVTHKNGGNNKRADETQAVWTRFVNPNSRSPLIPNEIRAKIEAIEIDACAKGWPAELLWSASFWNCPRGLAAILDVDDEIIEVTPDFIAISKCRRDIQRFRRYAA
jgi:hypothetical protein